MTAKLRQMYEKMTEFEYALRHSDVRVSEATLDALHCIVRDLGMFFTRGYGNEDCLIDGCEKVLRQIQKEIA